MLAAWSPSLLSALKLQEETERRRKDCSPSTTLDSVMADNNIERMEEHKQVQMPPKKAIGTLRPLSSSSDCVIQLSHGSEHRSISISYLQPSSALYQRPKGPLFKCDCPGDSHLFRFTFCPLLPLTLPFTLSLSLSVSNFSVINSIPSSFRSPLYLPDFQSEL